MSDDRLSAYRSKRDFGRTGEPRGERAAGAGRPVFVVQIHDARRMHFDFRLEVDGALKSWAVPRGPSADARDKRLAVPTEDHPMEYREFEGVIAPGEYGAGPVIVWDEGTYEPLPGRAGGDRTFAEALDHGHAAFRLHGAKLRGAYALTRFRGGPGSAERESWLLVRKKDDAPGRGRGAPDPLRARSVRTGRTLRQVAAADSDAADAPAGASEERRGRRGESGDG